MTEHELLTFVDGYTDRRDADFERLAWAVALLLAPHTKRKIKADDLLAPAFKRRRKERYGHDTDVTVSSLSELKEHARNKALKDRERAWLESPAGRRFKALLESAKMPGHERR